MRFPSLFRLPKHQQFRIKPRYYDPVKEEIKERTERIKEEIEGKETRDYHSSGISFKRKTKSAPFTSMLQLGIAALLGVMVLGWLQFGNDLFYYLLWIIVPGYLIYRLKSLRKRK
ncbi:hypothetical protein SAMN05421640_1699 [Ekhidna lutea]|uniref:Uncharacterized protein n=1 Tax=Ekhidna lutea TaxID=447679 RepID=A0A239IJV0_EKHLU|nr:hypothetical protein [Ekhidna lutea]SNS93845.1 hypothetical protein SAMN05421640_1699 [Ekhidna lutea]